MPSPPAGVEPTLRLRFCVMGAGHGGMAMAAHLSLKGFPVTLYNRSEERLAPVRELGMIELASPGLDHVESGEAPIDTVTTDPREALENSDVVMIVVPAQGHAFLAEQCAPYLRDDHTVVLNPGRTGGALEFRRILREHGCQTDPLLAETQTFIYASRATQPAEARIFAIKNHVPVAALPAYRTCEVLQILRTAYRQFVPADNVLQTSLGNVAILFHPAVLMLNSARVEDTHGDFQYYLEGITPSVARVLEAMDEERVALGDALGISVRTARQWLYLAYDAAGKNLHQAVQANSGYKGIMAPVMLMHRYILEDVPMSLVPMISLGAQLGVSTPLMAAVVEVCSAMLGMDFRSEGRTMESLGIAGLTVRQIRKLVIDGDPGEA